MKTTTDYWLINKNMPVAKAYASGYMGDIQDGGTYYGRKPVFDIYHQLMSDLSSTVPLIHTVTRISRTEPTHDYFILPPNLAREAAKPGFDYEMLLTMREPAVVHFEFERLSNDLLMLTCQNPLKRQILSTANEDDMDWRFRKDFRIEPTTPIEDAATRQHWFSDETQDGFFMQAIMFKYFTLDMKYGLTTMLLPLATSPLPFEEKLTLLRGEFKQYLSEGLPKSMLRELLPRG